MGRPKALLAAPDGHPFVAAIVHALASAGIRDVIIVTGRDHDQIVATLEADPPQVRPRFARNPDPSRGQLSSLWVGMDAAVDATTEALLMTLVDVPMIRPSTIVRVVETWRRTRAPIVRPAIDDRHGHPVLFDGTLFEELRRAPLEAGAKAVVRAHERDIVNVPVDDEGCLVDVDTPAEYEALQTSPPGTPHVRK